MTLTIMRGNVTAYQIHGFDLMEDAAMEVFWTAGRDPTLTTWTLSMTNHVQIWERTDGTKKPTKKFPAPRPYPV